MSAARRPVLVMGFGPFLDVVDNPAAALVRAVDGADVGARVVGRVMTVSYDRAVQETLDAVAELDPRLVLGVGVAANRDAVCVEAIGRKDPGVGRPDVDGQLWSLDDDERGAPIEVRATLGVEVLAQALGARLSTDAGRYVCNAWLYRVARAVGHQRPVGFVHVPAEGMEPERLLRGLRVLLDPPGLLG